MSYEKQELYLQTNDLISDYEFHLVNRQPRKYTQL